MEIIELEDWPHPIVMLDMGEDVGGQTYGRVEAAACGLPAYVMASNGLFLMKKAGFWTTVNRVETGKVTPFVDVCMERKVPAAEVAQAVAFMIDVAQAQRTESLVLLDADSKGIQYTCRVPIQWTEQSRLRYDPGQNTEGMLRCITLHSHPGFGTSRSNIDEDDETELDKEGIHIVVAFTSNLTGGNVKMSGVLGVGEFQYQMDVSELLDIKGENRESVFVPGQEFIDMVRTATYPNKWHDSVMPGRAPTEELVAKSVPKEAADVQPEFFEEVVAGEIVDVDTGVSSEDWSKCPECKLFYGHVGSTCPHCDKVLPPDPDLQKAMDAVDVAPECKDVMILTAHDEWIRIPEEGAHNASTMRTRGKVPSDMVHIPWTTQLGRALRGATLPLDSRNRADAALGKLRQWMYDQAYETPSGLLRWGITTKTQPTTTGDHVIVLVIEENGSSNYWASLSKMLRAEVPSTVWEVPVYIKPSRFGKDEE